MPLFIYDVDLHSCKRAIYSEISELKYAMKESKTHSRETEQPREDLEMTDDRTIRENFKIMD